MVTDRPILVTFKHNGNNYEFTVEDFGVGLSHEEVINIISKYGKSTKQLSDTQLGMFGLGWKCPLSYVSSFTFITRKDGIERKYTMSEGEEENVIDLLDEDSTDLPNGVKIIIPVSSYDVKSFFNKIKEQLCYFESVYFDVKLNGDSINNDFKITRYEEFQLSELNIDKQMHICLDNVYYPLDFKKIGINPINVPVGLRFGLSDGIYPTPNREAIRYSTEAKDIIKEKIKTVSTAIIEMYNKSVINTDDIKKIVDYYSNDRRYIDIGHESNIQINDLKKYSSVSMKEPKMNGISLLNLKRIVDDNIDEFVSEYDIVYELRRGKMREMKGTQRLHTNYFQNYTVYKFSDRLGGNKKEYLKSIATSSYNHCYVKKKRNRKLFPDKSSNAGWGDERHMSYYTLLELANYPKNQWRDVIKEFLLLKERFEKQIKDADAIDIPKAWLDSRKAARVYKTGKPGHQKLEGEMSCKRAEALERYVDGKNCKFTPFSIDLGKIERKNMFYIYTSHDNSLKLDVLFEKVKRQEVELLTFSEREINKLKDVDIHNLISLEKFMKGENNKFKRMVTSYLITKLIDKNSYLFRYGKEMANVSTALSNKFIKLNKYANENYFRSDSDEIFTAMLEVAEKYSLFDHSIYGTYQEIKTVLDNFPFLNTIYNKLYEGNERDQIVVDLLKYHKYKVNLNWYEKKVIEEVVEKEEDDDNN